MSPGNTRDSVGDSQAHTAAIGWQRERQLGRLSPDSGYQALIPWNLWLLVARGQSKQPEVMGTGVGIWSRCAQKDEKWEDMGRYWGDMAWVICELIAAVTSPTAREGCSFERTILFFSTSTLPVKVLESSGLHFRWCPSESPLYQLSGKMLTYSLHILKQEWQYLFLRIVVKINDDKCI